MVNQAASYYYKAFKNRFLTAGSGFVPRRSDVMLVSYPKSGNTWLRALLCNVVKESPSLSDMEVIVPDIYVSSLRSIDRGYEFGGGVRVIKSHEFYRPYYKRVIYIVRDPRDVMVSYYHHLKKRGLVGESFSRYVDDFVSGNLDGFGSWRQNLRSWMAADDLDIIFIRYEDLLDSPIQNLSRVLEFIGLDVGMERVKKAIECCAIDKLRDKELSEGNRWSPMKGTRKDINFFRSGRAQQWRDYDPSEINKIVGGWREEMRELNYEIEQ